MSYKMQRKHSEWENVVLMIGHVSLRNANVPHQALYIRKSTQIVSAARFHWLYKFLTLNYVRKYGLKSPVYGQSYSCNGGSLANLNSDCCTHNALKWPTNRELLLMLVNLASAISTPTQILADRIRKYSWLYFIDPSNAELTDDWSQFIQKKMFHWAE